MNDKRMIRPVGFAAGFLAFLAAHAIQTLAWRAWFGASHEPWFLNSGRAIVLTLAAVGLAGFMVALSNRSGRTVRGITVSAGAFVAMSVVLVLKPGGAGTIFPIVMVAGGLLMLGAATFGAWLGREVRRILDRA